MSNNVKIPIANPIRIRPTNTSIDYDVKFPRFDLMEMREDYQKGINAQKDIIVDRQVGKVLYVQMHIANLGGSLSINARLNNADTGTNTLGVVSNITPIGYLGYVVYQWTFTPSVKGNYYLTFNFTGTYINENYISDLFYATDDAATEKKFVEFKYRNSYNRDGMIWGATHYNFLFTGFVEPGNAQTENSISKEDDGVNIYNTISYPIISVTLSEMHITQIRQLEKIINCDDLLVNGIRVVAEQGIEKTRGEKSDLYNVTINLTQKDIDDFANFD